MPPVHDKVSNAVPVDFAKDFVSFITGDHNDDRIDLQYYHDPKSKIMYAEVSFGSKAQGPPRHTHGGAIAAVFDELMGACCWVNNYPALTAQYTTRFFKPVPLQAPVLFEASITGIETSKISVKAQATDGRELIYASAKGLFILQSMETFEKMGQTVSSKIDQT